MTMPIPGCFRARCHLIMMVVLMTATHCLADTAEMSARDMALVNRLTWGASQSEWSRIKATGMEHWLQDQLHPAPGDHLPAHVTAQIDALPMLHKSPMVMAMELTDQVRGAKADQVAMAKVDTLTVLPTAAMTQAPNMPATIAPAGKTLMQQQRQTYLNDALRQAQARTLLRDLYSADQLREQMTWFWFNHFNVFEQKNDVRLFIADYEDHALRPNALGHFRDLLEATLRAPAMLQYLDNVQNAAGHINENYAREIMELHTMGVGSGYTQKDVQELARILTGVGITRVEELEDKTAHVGPRAIRDGMFAFYPARHDFGDKVFLGHTIKGSGYAEIEQALDILASQPATAQHISRKLAQYFVADTPPPALINHMAARFQSTRGDIAAVLDLLFHAPEFRASLATPLLKDPQHYVLSAVRMAYDDRVILNTRPMLGWLNQLAEPLYGHLTPDGYALDRTAWNGPGQIEQRFEIAQTIGSGSAGLFKGDEPHATAHPGFPQLEGALYYDSLANMLSASTRSGLAQATSPQEWNVLFLASPDFMGR